MSGASRPFDIGEALHQALALQRRGELREAERLYSRVLKAAPNNFDALNLLGAVKLQQGRIGEAQRLLHEAVAINPGVAAAWCNLGQALHALKRAPEALACLDKARALAPDDVDILNQHAAVLLTLARPEHALAELQHVVQRRPGQSEARIACGVAHAMLGSHDRALAEFDAALGIAPGHPAAHYNRGVALLALGRYADAVAANDGALAAAPANAAAWLNRGKALMQLNRYDEALASFDRALALRKDYADAHFNAALARLAVGDYRRGFAEYEWRWRRTGMPPTPSRGKPLWTGDYPLAGRTILLHGEQGFGDTVQFARYVPLLAERGAKAIIEVRPELTALLSRLSGVAAIVADGETPPPFDVHCPFGSLPLAFRTEFGNVPATIPYLSAEPARIERWAGRLDALARPRIAVVWAGNRAHDNDRNRSIEFGALAPLFAAAQTAGATVIGIQRDLRSEDAAALASQTGVVDLGGAFADFADTAAVLACCDLVVSVDTAAAHVAGAIGRPVWVLLPFAPDWRWTLHGDTTPWYPTARLFRQSAPGDWNGVIARVSDAIREFSSRAKI